MSGMCTRKILQPELREKRFLKALLRGSEEKRGGSVETVNQSVAGKFEWSENFSHVNFSASRFILKTNFLCSFFVTGFSKVFGVRRFEILSS